MRQRKNFQNHILAVKNYNALSVICEDKEFETIKECANFYNVDRRLMNAWLLCDLPMPQEFIDKKLRYKGKDFVFLPATGFKRGKNGNAKKVYCEGRTFDCLADCAEFYEVNYHTIANWINGNKKMPKLWSERNLHYLTEEELLCLSQ